MKTATAFLALLLLTLLTYKVLHGVENLTAVQRNDGGYYLNVASHIRDGHGIATNVSIYHKGYTYFPHESSVAPLWPLLLGGLGLLFPLIPAAIAVNSLLYFITLLVGYRWARRTWPEDLFAPKLNGVHAGHVWVLVMGFNFAFFHYTSLPYTEGVAFSLLLLLILRAERLFEKPGIRSGLELGLWLGILILARGQMVLVSMAALGALGLCIVVGARRAASMTMAAVSIVTAALVLLPEYLYIRTFIPDAGLTSVLRFDQNRATEFLSAIPVLVPTTGIWDYIVDRAPGFLYAYNPTEEFSYFPVFNGAEWSVLIALPAALVWLLEQTKPGSWSRWRNALLEPRAIALCFVVLLALGGFFSLHTLHKVFGSPWNFGRRQALIAGLLFFLAIVWMLRRRQKVSFAAVSLVLIFSSVGGMLRMGEAIREGDKSMNPAVYRKELVEFLLADSARLGRPLVVTAPAFEAVRLARLTGTSVNYHWVFWDTTKSDYRALFDKLGVDYALIPEWFTYKQGTLDGIAEVHRSGSGGARIFKRRPPEPDGPEPILRVNPRDSSKRGD